MPNSVNFCNVPFLHMRSKAFSRSRNTATNTLFSSFAHLIADSSRVIWSMVDLCFLKSDCVCAKQLLFSKCAVSRVATIVSMVLHMADVRDIGL